MAVAIIIGVAILGLVLAFAIYASRAMRKAETKQPPPDGSGAEGDGGDGGGDGD